MLFLYYYLIILLRDIITFFYHYNIKFLYYQNMEPNFTKHVFLRKSPLRDVFCQSAITKMTVGTVRSFHCSCEQVVLLR